MPDKIAKFIASLDAKTKAKLKKKILLLKENPFSGQDIKKMKNWGENVYRLRMGRIRVIYQVIPEDIEIIDIDYRGNIY